MFTPENMVEKEGLTFQGRTVKLWEGIPPLESRKVILKHTLGGDMLVPNMYETLQKSRYLYTWYQMLLTGFLNYQQRWIKPKNSTAQILCSAIYGVGFALMNIVFVRKVGCEVPQIRKKQWTVRL